MYPTVLNGFYSRVKEIDVREAGREHGRTHGG